MFYPNIKTDHCQTRESNFSIYQKTTIDKYHFRNNSVTAESIVPLKSGDTPALSKNTKKNIYKELEHIKFLKINHSLKQRNAAYKRGEFFNQKIKHKKIM